MSEVLDSLCTAIVDCEHKTAPEGDGFAYSVGTKAMKDGRIVLDACKPVSAETYDGWTRRLRPEPGDLILAREAPVGQVVRVPAAPLVCLGQRTVLIRPDKSKVHPRFLHYWLLGPAAQHVMNSQAAGATVPHLNVADIRALDVSEIPGDPEQQSVTATLLGALDDLIENNRRRVELLQEMAKGIYQEWFVHFRYPGHDDAAFVDSPRGLIPEGWEVLTLGGVLELRYGKALKKGDRRGGPVAVLGSSGVVGWHDEELVPGPAVVVGRKGNVGSVMWVDGGSWPIDTTYFVSTDLPLRYVVEQLRRTEFLNTHAAVPGLSRDQAYSRPFLKPPRHLMDEFSAVAEILATEASLIGSTSERLAVTRDLLLPKLVTGQIDVSSLDLDAAIEASVA
jgi:type I restriction enzyme S subunit